MRIWDAATGRPIGKPLTGHTNWVNAVAIGAAGDRAIIASAGSDRTVRIWDATTGRPIQTIALLDVPTSLAFDPSGALIVGVAIAVCRFDPPR